MVLQYYSYGSAGVPALPVSIFMSAHSQALCGYDMIKTAPKIKRAPKVITTQKMKKIKTIPKMMITPKMKMFLRMKMI